MGVAFGGTPGLREGDIWVCYWAAALVLAKPKLDRVAKYHHNHCSVDTSTTNAPIENWTKGDDFLWCNVPSANGIKKLGWFCITGCGIATGTANPGL